LCLKRPFERHAAKFGGLEIFRYIGPGFLVTVGFIDPGNWASNLAAGSGYGYFLLWVVTLSTLMLILLQHTAAHLGIATGLCLAEATAKYLSRGMGGMFLFSAVVASISTALAEILGSAIGLNMLSGLQLDVGAALSAFLATYMLLSRNYRVLEKWIIAFVSLIGLSFPFELSLVKVGWSETLKGSFVPSVSLGSMSIVMSVLGSVVMAHNIFLHSDVIQSRRWNLEGNAVVKKQLKFEFTDTLFAMFVGWAINSAMIIVAGSVFYSHGVVVTELPRAELTLRPLLGGIAWVIFALALIFAGFSSSVTAAMAGGSIFAGIFQEPFDPSDNRSRTGVVIAVLRGDRHLFRGGAFQGDDMEPDSAEHPAAFHDFCSYLPYIVKKGYGKVHQSRLSQSGSLDCCSHCLDS